MFYTLLHSYTIGEQNLTLTCKSKIHGENSVICEINGKAALTIITIYHNIHTVTISVHTHIYVLVDGRASNLISIPEVCKNA